MKIGTKFNMSVFKCVNACIFLYKNTGRYLLKKGKHVTEDDLLNVDRVFVSENGSDIHKEIKPSYILPDGIKEGSVVNMRIADCDVTTKFYIYQIYEDRIECIPADWCRFAIEQSVVIGDVCNRDPVVNLRLKMYPFVLGLNRIEDIEVVE